jgi:hypothetical protein
MPSSKNKFTYDLEPGAVEDQLFEDGLIQYAVGPDGLKIELTPAGNQFFSLDEYTGDKSEGDADDPPVTRISQSKKYPWYGLVFILLFFWIVHKFKKG